MKSACGHRSSRPRGPPIAFEDDRGHGAFARPLGTPREARVHSRRLVKGHLRPVVYEITEVDVLARVAELAAHSGWQPVRAHAVRAGRQKDAAAVDGIPAGDRGIAPEADAMTVRLPCDGAGAPRPGGPIAAQVEVSRYTPPPAVFLAAPSRCACRPAPTGGAGCSLWIRTVSRR